MAEPKWDYDADEKSIGSVGVQDTNPDGTKVYLPSPRRIADATAALRCAYRRLMAGAPIGRDAGIKLPTCRKKGEGRHGPSKRVYRLVIGGRYGRGVTSCGDG
jgi:hypothetical protein